MSDQKTVQHPKSESRNGEEVHQQRWLRNGSAKDRSGWQAPDLLEELLRMISGLPRDEWCVTSVLGTRDSLVRQTPEIMRLKTTMPAPSGFGVKLSLSGHFQGHYGLRWQLAAEEKQCTPSLNRQKCPGLHRLEIRNADRIRVEPAVDSQGRRYPKCPQRRKSARHP